MTTPELSKALGTEDAARKVFDTVAEVLMTQKRVEIDGFGAFEVFERKARIARNPRTGARLDVPAKRAVKFKPANALKRRAEQLPDAPGRA
ncbi:HU family DNA-binding protein [Frigoriglobus tundricola]|uniref:Uncharacterized protein n=1 Tax=Frigoriglobus tundricola TaxID=2774151 RepID=A0A6M5YIY5_9BACT|nr:HU family DNA-binding protein [Frigoriglobus tundricola]QJW94007.1 hypothetical protein FTUN_1524 [Frigoriglobus tundricola]